MLSLRLSPRSTSTTRAWAMSRFAGGTGSARLWRPSTNPLRCASRSRTSWPRRTRRRCGCAGTASTARDERSPARRSSCCASPAAASSSIGERSYSAARAGAGDHVNHDQRERNDVVRCTDRRGHPTRYPDATRWAPTSSAPHAAPRLRAAPQLARRPQAPASEMLDWFQTASEHPGYPASLTDPDPVPGPVGAADLAPVLQRPLGRPHLRPRRGPGGRVGQPRPADGPWRSLRRPVHPPGFRLPDAGIVLNQRVAQVLDEDVVVVVAGQLGHLGEAVALVEAAVAAGVGAAQEAAGRAQLGRADAEQLDQAAAQPLALAGPGDQQVVQAGHAGHGLAEGHPGQLGAGPGLDHHRAAGPVQVGAEQAAVGGQPLSGHELPQLRVLGLDHPAGDQPAQLLRSHGHIFYDRSRRSRSGWERNRMDVRLTGVYIADARLVSEGVAQPEDAMAVFVGRAGKGRIAPFSVRRSYTGAGGWYREAMAVLAPNGDVVWRSPERALTLRGSSKIDTFTDEVHGVAVDSDDDHELVLLVNGDEVGRVPMAVLDEDPPWSSGSETDVLDEALKKSTVVWVEVPGEGGTDGRAVPVWYGTLDGRVYVLVGGSEQHVPGLAEATRVTLVARSKEQQSLVAEVEASARVVDPKDPLFGRVAAVLLPRRLNLRDGEQAVDRWRNECTLVELTPSSIPAEV